MYIKCGCLFLLSREVIQYDDPKVSLVHTDVEKLEDKPGPVFNTGRGTVGCFVPRYI